MLHNFKELASNLKEKFLAVEQWPEIEFNAEDIARIKSFKDVTSVGKSTFQIKVENNHCIIPSQYILYAICIKELALEVKAHLDLFEKIKEGKSQNEVGEMLSNHLVDLKGISTDEFSKSLALQIFYNDDLHQEAKSIVNGSPGNYKIRSIIDFYTSIILKPINIPAVSSAILGKFIYNLAEDRELYNYFEKRFIEKLPFITKETKINKFVRNSLSFLYQYDNLSSIQKFYSANQEKSLVSIKDDEIGLTSIFKVSPTLLDEKALSMGDRIRFFKDPLYLNSEGNFVYVSTEWTDGTESRLDLASFNKLISKYYPEFEIVEIDSCYYLKCKNNRVLNTSTSVMNLTHLDFFSALEKSGIQCELNLANRFLASIISKPFVILTGLSGSGKTKIAQAFAKWICENDSQYCIVPVGADWTNREPLLGFPNALNKNEYVKPDNRALDLLLLAEEDQSKPYFLILDEMNLSHVERYFADFLSVMESKESISLHSGDAEATKVPNQINFPNNLFIIGTVNIDETTYMFSPKVLDRANVIEFRITKTEMEEYLSKSSELKMDELNGRGAGAALSFLELARDKSIVPIDSVNINSALLSFFTELKKTGAEFGFRSASEIMRFAAVTNKLEISWDTNAIIDAAIMQKLLPKVHGSQRKLDGVLKALGKLCLADDQKIEDYLINGNEINFEDHEKIKYPISFEKIIRMYHNLQSNGFTSYAEA